jgi:ribosomal protein L18E
MAVTLVGTSTGSGGGTNATKTLVKPTGVQSGDWLGSAWGINGSLSGTWNLPSGWTTVHDARNIHILALHDKIAGASEPTSYGFSTSTNDDGGWGLVALRGVDTTTPVLGQADFAAGGNTTSFSAPSVSWAGASDAISLIIASWESTAATITWPSGWTQLWSVNDGFIWFVAGINLTTQSGVTSLPAKTLTLSVGEFGECTQYALKVASAGGTTTPVTLSVTSTTSPAVTKQVGKVVAVASTTSPSLIKSIAKTLVVSSSTAVSVATTKVKVVALSVVTSTAVALTKQIGKTLAVNSSTSPSLVKLIGKTLAVTSTTTAALTSIKAKFVTLAVSTTTVPALLKQVGKSLAVTSTTQPSVVKQISKRLAVTSSTTVTLATAKVKLILLGVTTTTVPAITRQIGRTVTLAVSTTTLPTISKRIGKLLSVATTTQPAVTKRVSKTLAVASSTAASIASVVLNAATGVPVRGPTRLLGGAFNALSGLITRNRLEGGGGGNQLGGD